MAAGTIEDAIGTIEMELMTLVRHLETHGRRSSLYVRVDRSGYLALRVLDRLGAVPTGALADALQLDASTVTRQVNTLVASGFVARRPNPSDGRSTTLALTPDGRRAMRDVERGRRRVLLELFGDWTDDERRNLGRTLTKLNGALRDRVARLREESGPAGRP